MRIVASELAFRSRHASSQLQEALTSLRGGNGAGGDAPVAGPPAPPPARSAAGAARSIGATGATETSDAADADPALSLIRTLVELLTGRPVDVLDGDDLAAVAGRAPPAAAPSPEAAPAPSGASFSLVRRAVRIETEQAGFSARGSVATADGREIAVAVELEMARSHVTVTEARIDAAGRPRKDPLVLNLGPGPVRLAQARHALDLDADGTAEAVPLLASPSAYLALDANGNGRVDDGRELFGPRTGAGLPELATHDVDGNGWIDEGDPVFGRLALWVPEAGGPGRLESLGAAGIGAIALASAATPFALRGTADTDLGQVRRTGLYLTGDGRAGTLQEIDLTV